MRNSVNLLLIVTACSVYVVSSANVENLPILAFEDGYAQMFGDENLIILRDGKTVHLSLDKRTGSGFVSNDLYLHGLFSASIKLPSDYTAGVVVAFYMSNGDVFEKTHDELDFEFLGNIRGKEWRIQTNIYGNGSTNVGREERYGLWFDPSEDFHDYSILWTDDQIIFYVDETPIRVIRREIMTDHFPSKPMSLFATIWDGSDWATDGGRYRVNYRYSPFISEFSNLILYGCAIDPIEYLHKKCDEDSIQFNKMLLNPEKKLKMKHFRKKYMMYSYCYDIQRYKTPPAECFIEYGESERTKELDIVKFGAHHRHERRRHHRRPEQNFKTAKDV